MTETMLPDLEKKNMILGIETHDRFSALEFAEIIQKINSKYVAIILDAPIHLQMKNDHWRSRKYWLIK